MNATTKKAPAVRTILVVDHGLAFGGTVVVASALAKSLDAKRFKVIVITAANVEFVAKRMAGAAKVVSLRPWVTYQTENAWKRRIQVLPGGPLRRLGVYGIGALSAVLNLPYVLGLLTAIVRYRPDVVHCNNHLGNIEAAVLARVFGIPLVLHAHGFGSAGALARWVRSGASIRQIAISDTIRNGVIADGVSSRDVRVVYNPAALPDSDVRDVSLRMELGASETDVVVGIVGRIVKWKGQQEFLEACLRLLPELPNLRVVLVGDHADGAESYVAKLSEMASASADPSRVYFAGFIADPARIYGSLDLLVHASIEPEPFGLVITEAMAFGVPVIAASDGAPPEIIRHGVTGILQDPSDVDGLSRAIRALAVDPQLRTKLAAAAREDVARRFSPAVFAAGIEATYDELARR